MRRATSLANLDLNLLVILRELLRERNVTRAARQVGITQPAASAALGRLRRHFGDELLERTRGGFVLTPLGAQLATQIEVIVAGRHAASGDFRRIRRLMTDRPHRYLVRSSDDRALAAALIADGSTSGVELDPAGEGLHVQAVDFARFTTLLPRVARERGIRLLTVSPSDESLESVFSYLVAS